MSKESFLNSLKFILDPKDIKLDGESKEKYSHDWSSLTPSDPLVVTFPRNSSQIIEIIKLSNSLNQSILVSGGRTGLSGGATAVAKEVIISLEKMNKILDFDESSNSVKCEPGVITKTLQEFAADHNLFYPVDFSSSGSSHIGGNIATNAGGIKVFRYGLTGNYTSGIEIIDGEGVEHNYDKKLIKNATGPNPKNYFIGSEGIYGIIKSCNMQLISKPQISKVALLSFENLNQLNTIRQNLIYSGDIEAFEFFDKNATKEVKDEFLIDTDIGNDSPYFLIIEYFGNNNVEKILEQLLNSNIISDALISKNEKEKKELWNNRLFISESINKKKPIKFDVAVSASKFGDLVQMVQHVAQDFRSLTPVLFGHCADGNLHINFINNNLLQIDEVPDDLSTKIYNIVNKLKGTISAEHGIGYLKREALKNYLNPKELVAIKALKKTYDPKNILNRNKVI